MTKEETKFYLAWLATLVGGVMMLVAIIKIVLANVK
jgi:hypothetical protein